MWRRENRQNNDTFKGRNAVDGLLFTLLNLKVSYVKDSLMKGAVCRWTTVDTLNVLDLLLDNKSRSTTALATLL